MDKTQYLKETIEKNYRSLRSFAQKIGIPESTLRSSLNKKNGIYTMTLSNVFKICKGLGISVDSLDPFQSFDYSIEDTRVFNKYTNISDYHKKTVELLIDRLIEYEDSQVALNTSTHNQRASYLQIEEDEEDLLEEELKPGFLIAASGGENVDEETMKKNIAMAREIARNRKKENKE